MPLFTSSSIEALDLLESSFSRLIQLVRDGHYTLDGLRLHSQVQAVDDPKIYHQLTITFLEDGDVSKLELPDTNYMEGQIKGFATKVREYGISMEEAGEALLQLGELMDKNKQERQK